MIWEGVVALCVTKRQFLNRFNTADFHKMRQSMTITADLSLCWALCRCMISATVLTVRSLSLLASPVLLLRAPLTSLRWSRRTFLMIAFAVNPWRSYVYGYCFILANTLDLFSWSFCGPAYVDGFSSFKVRFSHGAFLQTLKANTPQMIRSRISPSSRLSNSQVVATVSKTRQSFRLPLGFAYWTWDTHMHHFCDDCSIIFTRLLHLGLSLFLGFRRVTFCTFHVLSLRYRGETVTIHLLCSPFVRSFQRGSGVPLGVESFR